METYILLLEEAETTSILGAYCTEEKAKAAFAGWFEYHQKQNEYLGQHPDTVVEDTCLGTDCNTFFVESSTGAVVAVASIHRVPLEGVAHNEANDEKEES